MVEMIKTPHETEISTGESWKQHDIIKKTADQLLENSDWDTFLFELIKKSEKDEIVDIIYYLDRYIHEPESYTREDCLADLKMCLPQLQDSEIMPTTSPEPKAIKQLLKRIQAFFQTQESESESTK